MRTEASVAVRTARAPWLAPALLAGGVIAASSAPILVRYAGGAEPLAISFWRCFVGSIVLLPFARRGLRRVTGRHLSLCAIAGIFLAVHFATWITSLGLTTVASSVLLVSTTPIFVALVAPWIVKEHLSVVGWGGIALAIGGTAVIAGLDFAGSSLAGNALALAGGATAGGYVLAGRLARRDLSIIPYAALTYGVAAVALGITCLAADVPLSGYPSATWIALAALIAGPQLLGHTVINLVLSQIDATTVSVSLMAEPVIATAAAAWLFDEIPTPVFYTGAAAILAAIYLVSSSQRPAPVPPA